MTKIELLRTGLLGSISYPAVLRMTMVITMLLGFFLVYIADTTLTNKNSDYFLYAKKKNGYFQNNVVVNSVNEEDAQHQNRTSNKLYFLT
jgi:hypothetical protein